MTNDESPERTPDGRWLITGGRRWRASDPAIPEPLRAELVDGLADQGVAVVQQKGTMLTAATAEGPDPDRSRTR